MILFLIEIDGNLDWSVLAVALGAIVIDVAQIHARRVCLGFGEAWLQFGVLGDVFRGNAGLPAVLLVKLGDRVELVGALGASRAAHGLILDPTGLGKVAFDLRLHTGEGEVKSKAVHVHPLHHSSGR